MFFKTMFSIYNRIFESTPYGTSGAIIIICYSRDCKELLKKNILAVNYTFLSALFTKLPKGVKFRRIFALMVKLIFIFWGNDTLNEIVRLSIAFNW